MTRDALCLATLLAALCLARPAESVGPARTPEAASVRAARLALPSVLSVKVTLKGGFGGPREGYGSAFVVGPGRALTCRHVVAGADAVTVTDQGGRTHTAEVVASSETLDLALLRLPAACRLPALSWGRSAGLPIGTPLMAAGNPLGYGHSVSLGVLSHPARDVHYEGLTHKGFLQTDAAINGGNSGGPLLMLGGEVVGVVAARRDNAEGLGFAVPGDQARKWVESLKE